MAAQEHTGHLKHLLHRPKLEMTSVLLTWSRQWLQTEGRKGTKEKKRKGKKKKNKATCKSRTQSPHSRNKSTCWRCIQCKSTTQPTGHSFHTSNCRVPETHRPSSPQQSKTMERDPSTFYLCESTLAEGARAGQHLHFCQAVEALDARRPWLVLSWDQHRVARALWHLWHQRG